MKYANPLQFVLNHFYQKPLFSLKLNTFNFVWELSLNSATFWYTSWFLYSHSSFYIDIQSLIQRTLIYNARKKLTYRLTLQVIPCHQHVVILLDSHLFHQWTVSHKTKQVNLLLMWLQEGYLWKSVQCISLIRRNAWV